MSSRNLRQPDHSKRDGGAGEAASYLAEAITELAQLARLHQLDMLGYLLEMAHMEAEEAARLHGRAPQRE